MLSSPSDGRSRLVNPIPRFDLLLVRSLGTAMLHCVVVLNVYAQEQQDRRDLHVDDARPVARAIEMLTSRHPGVVVTYEDPRYSYIGDMRDVTSEVRTQPSRGVARRVLVPFGGSIDLSYHVHSETDAPVDWEATLQAVLESHAVLASGGRFRVEQAGSIYHVVPTAVRDASGEWADQASVLDALITIPPQELGGIEILTVILEKVTEAAGVRVVMGTIPLNVLINYRGRIEVYAEPARGVLAKALQGIDESLTWRLLYGPDVKYYALNLRSVGPNRDRPVSSNQLTAPTEAPRHDAGPGAFSPRRLRQPSPP
jgi:hypothetical protein